MRPLIVFLLAAFIPASLAQQKALEEPRLLSSEFIGCSGDPDDGLVTATARRITSNGQVTFLVSSIGGCGLDGRNLNPIWQEGKLDLTFELYSPNDTVVMCDCEYWATFTFDSPAMSLPGVKVNGEKAKL